MGGSGTDPGEEGSAGEGRERNESCTNRRKGSESFHPDLEDTIKQSEDATTP